MQINTPAAFYEYAWRFLRKILKFLLAGCPSFLIAIPLNFFLVTEVNIPKWCSYIIVLIFQVTLNFFLCRKYVFLSNPEKSIFRQFYEFFSAVAIFRLFDWALYVFLVSQFPKVNFVVFQIFNAVFFALIKFFFCKKAIEGKY